MAAVWARRSAAEKPEYAHVGDGRPSSNASRPLDRNPDPTARIELR